MKNDMKKCIDCGVPLVKKQLMVLSLLSSQSDFQSDFSVVSCCAGWGWLGVEPQTHLYAVNSCF